MTDPIASASKAKPAAPAAQGAAPAAALAADGNQSPPRQVSDEEFTPFKERWVKENERLNERYDGVIKALQDAAADPFPDDLAKREDALRRRYDELRLRITELRKAGKDMLIPSLVLKPFAAKMTLAHAARDSKEYEIVRILLDQAKYEIDEAENAPVVDVRKDVLRMAGIEEKGKEEAAQGRGTLKKEPVKG